MSKTIFSCLIAAAVTISGFGLIRTADAQTVGDDNRVPSTDLNIPGDIRMVGKRDPNVRTAMAIVNGYVITETDVDHRLRWLLLQSGNSVLPADQVQAARTQVLGALIDETLQIQAAEADELSPKDAEVEKSYAGYAQQVGQTPRQLDEALIQAGSSPQSLKRQIKGEMAWQRVLGRRVGMFVNVSDDEVNATIQRLTSRKGSSEYRVAEIYVSARPGEEQQLGATAQRIADEIKQTGNFAQVAAKFSEASTAGRGGDLGWLSEDQLPEAWSRQAREMEPGQMAGPIPVAGGFSIIYLVDKRKVLVADPRDATLSLLQVAINFPPGTTEAQAKPAVDRFTSETAKINGCGSVTAIAQSIGAEVVENDQVLARNLPAPLMELLVKLNVGQATPPFGSLEDGVRVLVLCGRDAPQDLADPSFDQVKDRIENQRIEQSGRRYLRDLRRDAVIDYR